MQDMTDTMDALIAAVLWALVVIYAGVVIVLEIVWVVMTLAMQFAIVCWPLVLVLLLLTRGH